MKKALLVTTVSGFVPQFEMNNVRILQQMGYEVHYASNYHMPSYGNDNSRLDGTGIIRHQVDFERSPFTLKNIAVYKQLKKVMEEEQFDLVHCHTPMGGALARIAAHNTKTGPVLYTAHGFHFFKGAPLVNWLCYYPVEKMLSHYTDVLICINQEDYERAKKKFYAKQVIKIPGVGIDIKRIENIDVDRNKKREELGIGKEQKVLLFVGEMTKNKNHRLIIEVVAKLHDSSIIAVFCGHGQEEQHLRELAKTLHVEEQIRFLGYRKDVLEIYKIADLFVFPSMREGLPVALIEAMASGLAVVCSKVRGNTDLIADEPVMAVPTDVDGFCKAISKVLADEDYRKTLADKNQKAVQKFDKQNVISIMSQIYRQLG
mgnify:CR=1 FL=1